MPEPIKNASVSVPAVMRKVLGRYVRAFSPERIILFGSYAKGTYHPGSDIDLLIVADIGESILHHHRRARELAADCFPTVDPVFASPEEVDGAASAPSPFLFSILGSGITVYERP
jgi:uncharacterized protein